MTMDSKDVFDRLIKRDVPRMCKDFFESIPDEQLIPIVWKHLVEKKPETQTELEFLAALPKEGRWLHLIMILDGEVRNGGFNQYFFNTEGSYAEDTIEALQKMCGTKHAEPMENALRFLREQAEEVKPAGAKKRSVSEMLDTMGDAYDDLDFGDFDADWKRLEKPRNLQMARFVRTNSASFLDSEQELQVSDSLDEPKKFVDNTRVRQECEPIAAESDKNTRVKKFLALATKYAETGKNLEAECVIREAIASMRWMPMGGTKDPMFFEILRHYETLLQSMGRNKQSEAIHEHLKANNQVASKRQ